MRPFCFLGLVLLVVEPGCVRARSLLTKEAPRGDGPAILDRAVERAGDQGSGEGLRDLAPGESSGPVDLGPCPGGCWIGNICHAQGAKDSADVTGCRVCDPDLSPTSWGAAKGCVVTIAGFVSSSVMPPACEAFTDGPSLSATFCRPEEMAFDASGRLVIADAQNHRIRVFHRGQVSTLAGTGTAGWVDGPTNSALLNAPHGIASDGAGAFIVGELGGRRVRRIANGVVSTLAGDGTQGFLDGPALSAKFVSIFGIAAGAGKVYVADMQGSRLRVVENGQVSTLAGDGTLGYLDGAAVSARFHGLYGVLLDGARLIVSEDDPGNRIRAVESGVVTTLAGAAGGGHADGPLASAKLGAPNSLSRDGAGRIFLAECSGWIRMIDQGQLSTIAGNGSYGFADGPIATAKLGCPTSALADGKGRVFFSDTHNHRIRVVNP